MKYSFNGQLFASICDGHRDPVPNTVVRLYRLEEAMNAATAYTAAQSKEVSQVFDEKQVKSRKHLFLAETTTDQSGNYSFEIDGEKHDYHGGAVAVVLYYNEMPDYGQHGDALPKNFTMFEVLLDVVQPKWRETNDGLSASWNHTILQRIWCYILQRLDLWVICGTVLNCKSQEPIQGIEVTAMDDDIITDDLLGTGVTNSEGRFCIVYRSIDFKKTFLSPFINIETTPPFSFDSGPDVYFKFSIGGEEFYAESPSEAQQIGRKNVGNCLCVRLCLDNAPSTTQDPPAAFYEIGYHRKYHPILNIDPTSGKTTGSPTAAWNEQAFYSTIELRGSLSEELNGNPVEYKFQYAEVTSPTDDISTVATWTDVTEGDIANTIIASRIVSLFPFPQSEYYAIKAAGSQNPVNIIDNWIQVPQYSGSGFDIFFNGALLKLDTRKLAVATVDKASLVPGNSSAPFEKNRYFIIRMLKREQGNPATEALAGFSRALAIFNTTYQNVGQGGSQMPSDTSNELGIATLDLQELVDGGACSELTNTITVNYTAANPNLGNVSLTMYGPGATNSFAPISVASPEEEAHGSSAYTGDYNALQSCAYEVRLHAELNLTNGEQQHHTIWDRVIFCR